MVIHIHDGHNKYRSLCGRWQNVQRKKYVVPVSFSITTRDFHCRRCLKIAANGEWKDDILVRRNGDHHAKA